MNIEKKFLNVDEVAASLGVCRNTVYWWAQTGKIPHSKLGKLVRFDPTDVASWVKSKSRAMVN